MELSKTVVCKLKTTTEDSEQLLTAIEAFRQACNYISSIAFEQKVFSRVALHHLTYKDTRQKFKVPANFVVRAIDRVMKAYKQRKRKLLKFTALSMDLDEKLFRLVHNQNGIEVSIRTLPKRKEILLDIGEYQRTLLEGIEPTYAVLTYKKKIFFIHITVTRDFPEPKGNKFIGVDVGMNNLLVASNGFKVKGKHILKKRQHFRELRTSLQKRGTKSAKRQLKRLSGKEGRWVNTVLHQVSHEFIESLRKGDVVVMEKLTGIRTRIKHRRSQRGAFHSWAFKKLQFLIEYKAIEKGIPVTYVNPKNTSRTCPRCGYIKVTNRRTQSLFRCAKCGFQHNADVVAALNLSRVKLASSGWADINLPIVACDETKGVSNAIEVEHSYKPPNHLW